tara:strand:- start:3963 stop:4628 length:666 start_codon:yes stop_codon:yes gene_type:complete
MVEILCPHCEGEIELDDDAKGEFACPLCDGEFEWGMDDSDDDFNFMVGEPSNSRDVLREFSDNPAIRITAGSIFATMMGIYAAFVALPIIFGGLFVSSLEGAADTGTGFGAIFILIGIAFLIFFVTGITFGVLMAKGKLSALIVCTVLSVIALVGTIVGWLFSDDPEAECIEYDNSSFFGECLEYESSMGSVPIGGIIIWTLIIAMNVSMLAVPQFRYQFD